MGNILQFPRRQSRELVVRKELEDLMDKWEYDFEPSSVHKQ